MSDRENVLPQTEHSWWLEGADDDDGAGETPDEGVAFSDRVIEVRHSAAEHVQMRMN